MMSGSLIRVVQKICVERVILCCFLLLASALSANSEERLVYRESYVLLFENVIADNPEKDVFLYINGTEQSSLIVIFSFGDGAIMAEWRMDNYTKIFIDANRNIKIANIDKSYEGKYYIQSSGRCEVELTVSEKKLTYSEEDIKNWLDDHSGFIEKYLGNLTDEVGKEISKWLEDHPGVFKKLFDSSDLGLYSIMTTIFAIVTLLLLVELLPKLLAEVCTLLKSSRWRKYSLIKDQDQKWLHDHPNSEEKSYGKLTEDQIWEQIQKWSDVYPGLFMKKYLEKLTDDQIRDQMQKCLGVYPVFMEKYFGKLTEDQICEQIQKWQDVYPGLFMKKYLDEHENDLQAVAPTLDELSVTLMESGNETEGNQMQMMSTQKKFIASQSSETPKEEQIQKWVKDHSDYMEKFVDEPENYHQDVSQTIVDLGIKRTGRMTEREDNQKQWTSSQKKVISLETCSSSSSEIEVGLMPTAHQRRKKRMASVNKREKVTEV